MERERRKEEERLRQLEIARIKAEEEKKKRKKNIMISSIVAVSALSILLLVFLVILPFGLKSVGRYSYYINLYNVSEFEIPDGHTYISSQVFMSCKDLDTVIVPKSVEKISKYAFQGLGDFTIKYCGTEEEWQHIQNRYAYDLNADITIIYNYTPE